MQKGGIALASARAGNVIGGGDWAADRLVPDILRAFERNQPVLIRNPTSTRPWQHVLEPLSGYLTLAEHLVEHGQAYAEGWNFGPQDADARPVGWIVDKLVTSWGRNASWIRDQAPQVHEANYLKLDISKARQRLAWEPRWSLDTALDRITQWHHAWLDGQDMRQYCLQQIQEYTSVCNRKDPA
jgi:CDP-glucose 4,6-dehydratase